MHQHMVIKVHIFEFEKVWIMSLKFQKKKILLGLIQTYDEWEKKLKTFDLNTGFGDENKITYIANAKNVSVKHIFDK